MHVWGQREDQCNLSRESSMDDCRGLVAHSAGAEAGKGTLWMAVSSCTDVGGSVLYASKA